MKTAEEARSELVAHVDRMVRYWATLPGEMSVEDRCDGVAFSLLTMLDGAAALPHITLSVTPGAGDDYPDNLVLNDDVDLHDVYAELRRAAGK